MKEYWKINNNYWNKDIYAYDEAIKLSRTLVNCYNCYNCEYCYNCNTCLNCNGCFNCYDCQCCENCHNCHNYKGVRIWKNIGK